MQWEYAPSFHGFKVKSNRHFELTSTANAPWMQKGKAAMTTLKQKVFIVYNMSYFFYCCVFLALV